MNNNAYFKWFLRAKYFLTVGIKKEFEVSEVGLLEFINRLSEISKCNLSLAKYLGFSKTELWIFIRPLLCSTRGKDKMSMLIQKHVVREAILLMGRYRAPGN